MKIAHIPCGIRCTTKNKISAQKQTLKKFLLSPTNLDPSHSVSQYDFLKDNEGNMAVDFVGRFENFENDFIYVCNHLNTKGFKLPHINKRNKKH
jgi:hypothetical protein